MSGFFQNLLKDAAGTFFGSDYLRDYTHASKSFRTNLYQNSPKFKFLFHCYFNINTDVYGAGIPPENFSILVRDVKLPGYQMQTHTMNQYNRKRIIQTKIKYDPVTFSFFDDNGNTIAKLWQNYYNYYYNDGTIPEVAFTGAIGGKGTDLGSTNKGGLVTGNTNANQGGDNNSRYFDRNLYNPSITGNTNWGYNSNPGEDKKPPFFKDITVFGFYQHSFIAYTLINPVITQFAHDTYAYDEINGVMKNNMTIDYETVVYNEGNMKGTNPSDIVTGFGTDQYYDKRLSPIAQPGSNNTILGQGGLVSAFNSLKNTDFTNPKSILGAIKTAGTAYNTIKNSNLKQTIAAEATTGLINVLRQEPNQTRNTFFNFLNPSAGPGAAAGAGAPTANQTGGTSSTPTNRKTDGTSYQPGPSGPVDLGAYGGFGGVDIPQTPAPAGKQSTTGGGVNLPPTGG